MDGNTRNSFPRHAANPQLLRYEVEMIEEGRMKRKCHWRGMRHHTQSARCRPHRCTRSHSHYSLTYQPVVPSPCVLPRPESCEFRPKSDRTSRRRSTSPEFATKPQDHILHFLGFETRLIKVIQTTIHVIEEVSTESTPNQSVTSHHSKQTVCVLQRRNVAKFAQTLEAETQIDEPSQVS